MFPEATTSWTLSTSDADALREKIVALTRSYLGVPWRHKGRTHTSIDCVGLPIMVGKELGLHDYDDSANYKRTSSGADLMRIFGKYCDIVSDLSKLMPGDILIFRDPLFPQHVGIMTSPKAFAHATLQKGRVVEEPLVGDMRDKLLRGYRFKVFNNVS